LALTAALRIRLVVCAAARAWLQPSRLVPSARAPAGAAATR
jgi:hypothetical protein